MSYDRRRFLQAVAIAVVGTTAACSTETQTDTPTPTADAPLVGGGDFGGSFDFDSWFAKATMDLPI